MESCFDIAIFLAICLGLFYRKGCWCGLSDSHSVGRKRSSQLRRPKSRFDSFLSAGATADRICSDTLVDSSGKRFVVGQVTQSAQGQ